MEILEHQTLEMHKVLSFRKPMSQTELVAKMREIDELLEDYNIKKTGPTVSSTFSVRQYDNGPIADIEILIPVERDFNIPEGYKWKEHFLLCNSLLMKYQGAPAGLPLAMQQLNNYINEKHYLPISSCYNVAIKEANSLAELNDMEVHVYVSVSPNLL